MWMTAASLAAWWLWCCGALKRIGSIPFGPVLLPTLLGTTFLCRSTGALALLVAGMAAALAVDPTQDAAAAGRPPARGPRRTSRVRLPNLWTGQQAVDLAKAVVGPDRAQSLEYRFMCENLLAAKALQQPIFGWGGWGRSAVYFDRGRLDEAGPDRRAVDHRPGVQGIRRPDPVLPGPHPAGGPVRLALPGAAVGRPPAGGRLARRGAAGPVHDRLPAERLPEHHLRDAGRRAHQPGSEAAPGDRGPRGRATGRRAARAAAVGTGRRRGAASGRIVLADRCRTLGRSFKQEGRLDEAEAAWRQALDLLGTLIEADPGADELRRRWCDCANDLAWLRANHPDPSRRDPVVRRVDGPPGGGRVPRRRGLLEHAGGRPLPRRRRPRGRRRPRSRQGPRRRHGLRRRLPGHGARTAGHPEEARRALARAMLQAERDYPGHPELAAFCDEAHSLLAGAAIPAAR